MFPAKSMLIRPLYPRAGALRDLFGPACAVFVLLAFTACSQQIPNTSVDDTSANRRIVAFMETYRHALEKRDVAKILSMASERYLDTNGTPKGEDDVDFEKLKVRLAELDQLKDARVEMRYRRISFDGSMIYVELRYHAMFLLASPDGKESWKRAQPTDHRFVLEKDGDTLRFLSGL